MDYANTYQEALEKLEKGDSQLSKKHCCVILFCSFGIFFRDTKISAVEACIHKFHALQSVDDGFTVLVAIYNELCARKLGL